MPRRRNPSKPKIWRIKENKPNWLDLPPDLTANILHRLGAIEILDNAQNVCTAWRNICKDPGMWRVIDLRNADYDSDKMCMHAIDRSQGQLVDIKIEFFCTNELIEYMAVRSSQLRRIHVAFLYDSISESWCELFKKLPLLEELSLVSTDISKEAIAYAGQYCPMLRSYKFVKTGWRRDKIGLTEIMCFDEEAIAIAKNMTQLRHLQLIGNNMTNKGLQAILDGCPHLVSLDLRRCFYLNVVAIVGKRCSEQIKDLKLPEDSTEDCDYNIMSPDYDNYDSEGLSDYDIYWREGCIL